MEDLQAALQSVLSDPKQMEQIMAMADALGLHPPESGPSEAAPDPAVPESGPVREEGSDGTPGIDPALLRILGRLGDLQGPEVRVLNALRPVISDPSRIDRALRAARLSRLAGRVLNGGLKHV